MCDYAKVAIFNIQFSVYVSLNGTGITHYREQPYQGTVHSTNHAQAWETFNLRYNDDGTVSFEASVFPRVFLSLDGNGVEAGVTTGPGGGSVAAQYTAKDWEKFLIRRQDDNTSIVAIESAAFPGRFLRVNGDANEVNVQGTVGPWEKFRLEVLA